MAFKSLPLELNKEIAGYLEDDQDVCNFRLVCLDTLHAVDGDNFHFWRKRYLSHFEWSDAIDENSQFAVVYQHRRRQLRGGARFRNGATRAELWCLQAIAHILIESFNGAVNPDEGGPTSPVSTKPLGVSLNQKAIERFVFDTNILSDIFRPGPTKKTSKHPLLTTLQVVFAHWSLDLRMNPEVYGFEQSQKMVYECAKRAPIFNKKWQVNMEWVLHTINFFKYHMLRSQEHTLYGIFAALEDSMKPKPWKQQLKTGTRALNSLWKGTYAFLSRDEMTRIRNSPAGSNIFMDQNVDQGQASIQTILLSFNQNYAREWYPEFEHHLKALTNAWPGHVPAQQKVVTMKDLKKRSLRFHGAGYDDEYFKTGGWINALPDQNGIPGWQRLTMMKFFEDDNGDMDAAQWAYEGVVLPGDQIIIGRWWHPQGNDERPTDMYSGPFIFWNCELMFNKGYKDNTEA